jgi:hypothetical protein
MLALLIRFFILLAASTTLAVAQREPLIVTTDIGQDPDDQQSMVRLLHYANEFTLLGLVANADANYEHEPPVLKDSVLHALIDAYAKIEDNLRVHDVHYPTATYLRSIVKRGCAGNGTEVPVADYVGEGHDTEGSDWIIETVRNSTVPVRISIWGGAADLAQALWKVRATASAEELRHFIQKLRVYFIGQQDSSNAWIIEEFPEVWIVLGLDPAGDKWASGYRGMFLGGDLSLTSRAWLHRHVIGQNPLASQYPDEAYTGGDERNPHRALKEGDTPSWLFFLRNGLNEPDRPDWGGWGGRYQEVRPHFFRDAVDTVYHPALDTIEVSARATVNRWRPAFQQDFAARVQWGVKPYEKANHAPVPVVRSLAGDTATVVAVAPGQTLRWDATDSYDPDGDSLRFAWYVYEEAGTYRPADPTSLFVGATDQPTVALRVPESAQPGDTVHVTLEVNDDRELSLTGYRRLVLWVE